MGSNYGSATTSTFIVTTYPIKKASRISLQLILVAWPTFQHTSLL
jgi:hypothetical protein